MRPGAQLFNSGRGEVVDTAALKAALKSGRISAAVLDVWENEPGIDRELLDLVRIGTPHIAGYSTDGKANGTAMAVQAVAAFFGISGLAEWRPERLPEPETPEIRSLKRAFPCGSRLRRHCCTHTISAWTTGSCGVTRRVLNRSADITGFAANIRRSG